MSEEKELKPTQYYTGACPHCEVIRTQATHEIKSLESRLKEAEADIDLYKSSLRIIAEPERQNKYTPQQIAKHALRMEALKP